MIREIKTTGFDASLSFFSRSRRCSRNRSPSRLPVSPMYNFLHNRTSFNFLHQRTLFIQLIYSCFSRNLVSTNSIAPCSVYKPYTTHNSSIRSDEGLTLETSAFQSLYGGQPNFRVSLSHRRSTTVSLAINPLYSF